MKRLALFLLAFPAVATAHDFWIEPSTFRPGADQSVSIRFRSGEHFVGDPVPRRQASGIVRFEAHSVTGVVPVAGKHGSEPAGSAVIPAKGVTVIAYEGKPSYVEMGEDKLEQYLREEGLESVGEMRKRSPFAGERWREIYSRCAKTLLSTGSDSSGFDKRVGMTLELIPEKDPYTNRAGARMPFRLLYRGKPLAGSLITAIPASQPRRTVSARSDSDGLVTLHLDHGGKWLIKAVHIVPAPAGARGRWESFWASLTFDLRK